MTSNIKTLDGAEVCRIIEACAKAGVTHFRLGDLHLRIGRTADLTDPSGLHPREAATSPQAPIIEKEDLENAELKLKEEQLSMSVIEDPLAYEQALISGDLEDEKSNRD